MPEKILKAKMLGGFSLQYDGKEIILDRNIMSKTTQLMQIMLVNSAEGISKASLIDALYGRDEVENKNASLNNTIFRLRKQLRAAGLPDSNYINIRAGTCKWDDKIPLGVDVLHFERAAIQSQQEKKADKKEEMLNLTCQLYKGEFLPTMIGESWAAERNAYYKKLYVSCLQELLENLKKKQRFEKIYRMAHYAAEIYPYDEWQIWEIDSLIELSRFKEAMMVYERTTQMMFQEMNISPLPEMIQRAEMMSKCISQASGAIGEIKRRLDELDREEGAYYCSFPSFVDAYHVFARIMERGDMSVYIMLCTLNSEKENEEKLKQASEILQHMIQKTLRRGDFFTRYNNKQYLVMLPKIAEENCKAVSERIDASFHTVISRREFYVNYYVASIAEFYSDKNKKDDISKQ